MADVKVQKWILEYICRLMWNEFQISAAVNENQRDLIQGVLHFVQPSRYCPATNVQKKLLSLQCWLADGEEYNTEYSNRGNTCDNTALENFLCHFLSLLEILEINQDAYDTFIFALKEQAVLVCCRNNDFSMARNVYNRIFEVKHSELESLMKSKDYRHPFLNVHSYDQFVKKALVALRTFHEQLPTPVLEKVAKNLFSEQENAVTEVLQHVTREEGDQNGNMLCDHPAEDISMKSETLRETAQALGEPNWRAGINRQQLNTKLELIRKQRRSQEEQRMMGSFQQTDGSGDVLNQSVSTDKENATQPRTSASKRRVNRLVLDSRETRSRLKKDFATFRNTAEATYGYRRNRNRKDRHNLSSSGSSSSSLSESPEVGNLPTLGDRPVVRKSLQMSPRSNSVRSRIRVKWSDKEVEQLTEGVKRFGKGQWAKIRDAYSFNGRTTVDLKDKWRNIEHRA